MSSYDLRVRELFCLHRIGFMLFSKYRLTLVGGVAALLATSPLLAADAVAPVVDNAVADG